MFNHSYGKVIFLLTMLFFSACKTTAPTITPMNSSTAGTSMLFDIEHRIDLNHLNTELPDDAAAEAFKASLEMRTVQEAYLVQVNPASIKTDTTSLAVPFPDGSVVRFQQRKASKNEDIGLYWFGDGISDRKQKFPSPDEVDFDPATWIAVTSAGEAFRGVLHSNGVAFELLPVGKGQHLLIKQEWQQNSQFTGIHDDLERTKKAESVRPATKLQGSAAPVVVRVMVVSTVEGHVRALREAYLPKVTAERNLKMVSDLYQESGVNVEFQLTNYLPTAYLEGGEGHRSIAEILQDFSAPNTIVGATVAAARSLNKADVVLVGTASAKGYYVSTRKETAFAGLPFRDMNHSLAKTMGHIFGLEKSWIPGDPELGAPTYRFGHIARVSRVDFCYRTIISNHDTDKGRYGCQEYIDLAMFSNPNKRYNYIKMGTEHRNNAERLMNERLDEVANYYP